MAHEIYPQTHSISSFSHTLADAGSAGMGDVRLTDIPQGPLSEITSYLAPIDLGVLRLAGAKTVLREPALTKHLVLAVPQHTIAQWISEDSLSSDALRAWCTRGTVRLPQSITDDQLKMIIDQGILSNTQNLSLRGCRYLTGQGIASLSKLTQLGSLDLSWCFQLKDTDIAKLAELKRLTSLNLSNCQQITGEGLVALSALKHLHSLDLSTCRQFSEVGVAQLSALTQLRVLNLGGTRTLTDAGLMALARLNQLTSLGLSWCPQLSATSMVCIARLEQLEKLDLTGCQQLLDEDIQSLSILDRLQSLGLGWCEKITDQGMAAFPPSVAVTR